MGSLIGFRKVIRIILEAAKDSRLIVVVSAMQGITDELELLADWLKDIETEL